MFEFKADSNLDKISDAFDDMAKNQVAYATSLAINRVAEFSKDALRTNMQVIFDRPRPFTLNSLYVKKSTKTDLTARVGHKDQTSNGTPASTYLEAQIEGGSRKPTPFEKLFGVFGSGELVPTANARRDSYGGVAKAVRIGAIKASEGQQKANPKGYFVVPIGAKSRLEPGIYQRLGPGGRKGKGSRRGKGSKLGGRLKTIMLFKPATRYNKLYDMLGTVTRVIDSQFNTQFAAAMDYALGTAKLKLNL